MKEENGKLEAYKHRGQTLAYHLALTGQKTNDSAHNNLLTINLSADLDDVCSFS